MKQNKVPPHRSLEGVIEFLEFLLDPKAVKARLDEFEKSRQDLNRRIGAMENLDEAENLKNDAKADRDAAARELKAARTEAAAIISEARTGIAGDLEAIQKEIKALADDRAKFQADQSALAADIRQLAEDRKKLQLDRNALDREQQKVSGMLEQARQKQRAVDELLSQSKQVLSA